MVSEQKYAKFTTRRVVTISLFVAGALIVNIIESLFPPLLIPGAKIGLSNVFTLMTLVIFSPLDAFIVVLLKCLLSSFFGSISTLMYSLSAGLVSLALQVLLFRLWGSKLSIVSLSIFGGVIHNLTQNLVYLLVTQNSYVLSYSPYLALLGVISGCIVGVTVYLIISKIPYNSYVRLLS